ncbi:MAG: class I SAM-dependent methyltransferase [Pseudomonadota bacterium]
MNADDQAMDEHYNDPTLVALYDVVNAERRDFAFYRSRMPTPPCRVLDVGCGTGRFAIELAEAGYAVTGIDPAPAMIAYAQCQPGAEAVHWHVGMASDLAKNRLFDVAVMTGHAFQCLLSDAQVQDLFQSISERLAVGGAFWFETRNSAVQPWRLWALSHANPPLELGDGRRMEVVHEVEAVDGAFVTFTESYHFDDGDVSTTKSRLRFMTLPELETAARKAGLAVHSVAGNWDGAALDENSPEIIVELRHASAVG